MPLDKKDKLFGLPKNVFFAGLTSFFNDFSSEMIVSIFPAFFKSVLKSGAASLGLVEGIAEAAANFFKILSGRWSDKVQKRKIFAVVGYAISTITRPFYSGVSRVTEVVGLRLTDRIGKGLRDAPRDALISLSTPGKELGRAFGFHRAMDTTGAILGPFLAYLLLRQFPGDFKIVFSTSFVIGIVGVISFLLVKEIKGIALQQKIKTGTVWGNLSHQFKVYLACSFILAAGTLPVAILLLKTLDAHLVIADIPLFYMLYNIAYAVFSPVAGKMADKVGDKSVLLVGYGCLLVSYLVLGFSAGLVLLFIGFIFLGLFSALTDAVPRSYAGRLTTPETRGSAFGYLNGAMGFGALIAGVGGGYAWQVWGVGAALVIGAGIVFVGMGVLVVMQRRKAEVRY